MTEIKDREAVEAEIKRGHYARAALLALAEGMSEEDLKDLRQKALWQMAAHGRNAAGTKALAREYGYSRDELGTLLRSHAEKERQEGRLKPLAASYECATGKYLTFDEWLDRLVKIWDRLSVS